MTSERAWHWLMVAAGAVAVVLFAVKLGQMEVESNRRGWARRQRECATVLALIPNRADSLTYLTARTWDRGSCAAALAMDTTKENGL